METEEAGLMVEGTLSFTDGVPISGTIAKMVEGAEGISLWSSSSNLKIGLSDGGGPGGPTTNI